MRRSRSRGLTLIEVVAAIAILGSVLVGLLLAQSRHTDQLIKARLQSSAVVATDELIAQWSTQPQGVPIDAEGSLPAVEGVTWRTLFVANAPIVEVGARVVRVEVLDQRDGDIRGDRRLFVVDMVVPDPAVQRREQRQGDTDHSGVNGAARGGPE